MPAYNLQNTGFQQVCNQELPQDEGPRSIPLLLDFTQSASILVDLSNVQSTAKMSMVQTLFVDLSGTDSQISVSIDGTNQLLVFKPRTQGYYPVLCPTPSKLTFALFPAGTPVMAPGSPPIPVQVCNTPIFGFVWPTQ